MADYLITPSGGAEVGGSVEEIISFAPNGGAEIGGLPTIDGFEIGIGYVDFEVSRTFEWNVGDCTPYYYTVYGRCEDLDCTNVPFDVRIYGGGEDCQRRIVVTVMGCSLKEVCLALKRYKLIFTIDRVFKNHRPVMTIDQDLWVDDPPLTLGTDPCRVMEEVYPGPSSNPFELPLECAEFSLRGEIVEQWGWFANSQFAGGGPGEGGIEFLGDAQLTSTGTTMKADGGLEFGGDSDSPPPLDSVFLGSFSVTMGAVVGFDSLEASLSGIDADDISIDDTPISNDCVCDPIPPKVLIRHNLSKTSLLTYFLERNSFTIPDELKLFYSNRVRGWYGNLHYDGWASSSPYGTNVPETWDLFFEWMCTPEIGTLSMGNYVWKFGVYFKRIVGIEDYDTRIIIGFPTAGVCPPDINLRFTFTLDTDTELVTSTSSLYSQDVELLILFDNIGLFKSHAWKKSPNLIMTVSQESSPSPAPTFEMDELVPAVDLQLKHSPTQVPAPIFA